MARPRLAVTGLGVVSALGCTVADAVAAVRDGASGVRPPEGLDGQPWAAQVRDFDPGLYMPKKKVRRMDPVNTYVIAAARMALEAAGLAPDAVRDSGLVVGTGFAGLTSVVKHQQRFLEDGIAQLSPIHFPTTVYNASAGLAAIELQLGGPNTTVTGLDLPAEHALLYAELLLRRGMAPQLVLVGADELGPALLQGLTDLGLIARDPERPGAPFAAGSDGYVPGEGAAALVLELEDVAQARGAPALATVDGIGLGGGGRQSHTYDPSGEASARAVDGALERAGIGLEAIGWISAGGNGHPALDRAEAAALARRFDPGRHSAAAIKAYTGEFAGSGALRLALALACARAGFVPAPPADLPAPAALAPYMEHRPERPEATPFLHHGLGIGGTAVAVVVRPAA
jgi:3-oxoacyl-[acyl-carrier-protein] synthase II